MQLEGQSVHFDISYETLSCTTFGAFEVGSCVNIEPAMHMNQRLDGHVVLGHVDCVALLILSKHVEGSYELTFKIPNNFKHYIAVKGSVALDGVSLTVNAVEDDEFRVNIIPHTWSHTNLQYLKKGQGVNLEVDVLARYVARLMEVKGI